MIPIKTRDEIEIMREGGRRLKEVFERVLPEIKMGVSKKEIDKKVEKLILDFGGQPSFKMVPKYQWASCITVNEEVVHGVPNDEMIEAGDIVSLDVGMYYQGFHTDRAETIEIRDTGYGIRDTRYRIQDTEFLRVGKLALEKAIQAAIPGNRVGHISLAIQKAIEERGFSPVRALTGHGVGKKLHEEPLIPCFLKDKLSETPVLKEGMVLAIEVIYCAGKPDLVLRPDNWTVATKDGKISALFEETVAITAGGSLVLSNGA